MSKKTVVILSIITLFFIAYPGYAEDKSLRGFSRTAPRIGEMAPDFTLKDLNGTVIKLSQFRGERPLLIEFGSYTCPIYRGKAESMQQLYERYKDKINFFIVYTIEAHPAGSNSPYASREWITPPNKFQGILFPQPTDYQERINLARLMRKSLEINVPLLIDEMDNGVWLLYGRMPNSAFLIDAQGRVVESQVWFNPRQMEKAIISLLGKRKAR